MIYNKYFFSLLIISGSIFYSCEGEGNRKGSPNAPEIVERTADTNFNKVPGEAHYGIETYAEADGSESLMSSLAASGSFSRFIEAVDKAGMGNVFGGQEELTIFAPTDQAFSQIPQEKINEIFKPENKQKLIDFVNNHIVRGNINHGDLTDGKTLTALNGKTIQVNMVDGQPRINNSLVKEQESNPENGAVYALEGVIVPPEL